MLWKELVDSVSVIARRFLALLAVPAIAIGVAAGGLSAQAATGACTPSASWGTPNGGLAGEVVSLINQHRTGMGLAALSIDGSLADGANWKSMNMSSTGVLSHYDVDGRSPPARLAACGYANPTFGENIFYASFAISAQSVVSGWLGSPGHRSNIENPSFTSTGVGVATDGRGGTWWTQDFGATGGTPAPAPTAPPTAPPAPAPVAPPVVDPVPDPPADSSSPAVVATTSPAAVTSATTVPAVTAVPEPRSNQVSADRVQAPKAYVGERLAAALPLTGVDAATVQCTATLGSSTLPARAGKLVNGRAVCAWRPSASMRGKTIQGTISVTAEGTSITAKFSRYVRARR